MSKGKIITISILSFLVVFTTVLFGFVFRLRQVNISGDLYGLDLTNDEIIKTSNLKLGTSIFMLDKDDAISKIEAQYPKLKVVQIKTTGVTKVEIVVRQRKSLFTCQNGANYLVLDEELKVLEVLSHKPDLIEIDATLLNIDGNTRAGDFVSKNNLEKVTNDFYVALLRTVKIENTDTFVEHNDILDLIVDFKIKKGNTLEEEYDRLVVTTKYGVVIDIAKPNVDLLYKVNICFATINELDDNTRGTIKYFYLDNGDPYCGYFE